MVPVAGFRGEYPVDDPSLLLIYHSLQPTIYLSNLFIYLATYMYTLIIFVANLKLIYFLWIVLFGIKLRVQGRRELLSFNFFLVHLNNKNSTQKYPKNFCFLPPRRWRKNAFSFCRWRNFFGWGAFFCRVRRLFLLAAQTYLSPWM